MRRLREGAGRAGGERVTITFNFTETRVLLDMLERLSDVLSNAGCNDYDLPATPESKELLMAAYMQQTGELLDEGLLRAYQGQYGCMDHILLGYLQSKIQAAAGQMTGN